MDVAELGPLLTAQLPGLLRYARTLVRDQSTAEDVVQEALIRALQRAESFRAEASLATWLHRILHNLVVDQARRNRETPVEDVVDAVEAAWREDAYTVDAATLVARAEIRAELQEALIHLPIVYRTAVVLHDMEGLTAAQIADIQQISLPAAKQRLRRGRMMLVSELARGSERRRASKGVPMRCWDARSRISDFIDGELTAEEADRLRRHLKGCPTCPPLYATLTATSEALRIGHDRDTKERDPNSVVPPDLARRVAELLEHCGRKAEPTDR